MKVLVTGGSGFVGSHTVDRLISLGLEVVVVDKKASLYPNPKARYYQMDINDFSFESVFKENNIDKIIHLAAQPSVSFSNKNPEEDAKKNILASIRVIELAKKYQIQKLVVSSSAALYAKPQYFPVDEKHPTHYLSPYAISKHTMEEYVKWSGLKYIIFRYTNVYGPRQDSTGEAGVIAIFTDAVSQNKPIYIYGDGNQTRDFVYVKDVADANCLAVVSDVSGEAINISSQTEITINQAAQTIISTAARYTGKIMRSAARPGDIYKSVLSNQKAKQLLGFKNKTNFTCGIQETVRFFEKKG